MGRHARIRNDENVISQSKLLVFLRNLAGMNTPSNNSWQEPNIPSSRSSDFNGFAIPEPADSHASDSQAFDAPRQDQQFGHDQNQVHHPNPEPHTAALYNHDSSPHHAASDTSAPAMDQQRSYYESPRSFQDLNNYQSAQHAQQFPYSDTKSSSNGNYALTVVAAIIAVFALTLAGLFAFGVLQPIAKENKLPMRSAEIPDGFPADAAKHVPAALASTVFGCKQTDRIDNGFEDDLSEGTACKMSINGLAGTFVYADNKEWIHRAVEARTSFEGYEELQVLDYISYSYIYNLRGRDYRVITLVSEDESHFLDFVSAGRRGNGRPTESDQEEFKNAILAALQTQNS